ncbi:MAG: acetyltransferase [Mariprofundales bacterium]
MTNMTNMKNIDVFNGDADGICALHIMRLANPCDSKLITGLKRDIALLDRVQASAGDQITVLDISMEKNILGLQRLLDVGASIFYCDHHRHGTIPTHANLTTLLDTTANTCTSLLINNYLQGVHLLWAITAAFGDNLYDAAKNIAPAHLTAAQLDTLCHLGTCLNYNGYGITLDDLYFHPKELYSRLSPYIDPLVFASEDASFAQLSAGMEQDLAYATVLKPSFATTDAAVFMLPNEAWSRRVSGVFGNDLARQHPQRGHAIIMPLDDGTLRISVRAPLTRKYGADVLCSAFPTGGGRAAAAGINALPADMLDDFTKMMVTTFSS